MVADTNRAHNILWAQRYCYLLFVSLPNLNVCCGFQVLTPSVVSVLVVEMGVVIDVEEGGKLALALGLCIDFSSSVKFGCLRIGPEGRYPCSTTLVHS